MANMYYLQGVWMGGFCSLFSEVGSYCEAQVGCVAQDALELVVLLTASRVGGRQVALCPAENVEEP